MKCDALWVVGYEQLEVRPTEVPEPKYDEVQIQTKACGVCCWDSYQYRGISGRCQGLEAWRQGVLCQRKQH